MPKQPEAWADTINHLIKNATPRRKLMLNMGPYNDKDETVLQSVGLKRVGRSTKQMQKIKKKLAFTDNLNIWSSKKQQSQFKARKRNQVKRLSKTAQHRKIWNEKLEQF